MGRDHRCRRRTGWTPDTRPAAVLWLRGLGAAAPALLLGQDPASAQSSTPPRNPATDASALARSRAAAQAAQTYAGQPPAVQGPILSIAASPSQIAAPADGGPISYSLVVTNTGGQAAANVQVGVLKNGQSQSASAAGACTAIPCLIQQIPPGGRSTIRVTQPSAGGGYTLTARAVMREQAKRQPQSSDATITVSAAPPSAPQPQYPQRPPPDRQPPLPPPRPRPPAEDYPAPPAQSPPPPASADLQVSARLTEAHTEGGNQLVTYAVTVRNAGPDAASDVGINAFVGGRPQSGSASGDCTVLPCTLPRIPSGQARTTAVRQWVTGLGAADIVVRTSGQPPDPRPADNVAEVRVAAAAAPPPLPPPPPSPPPPPPPSESRGPARRLRRRRPYCLRLPRLPRRHLHLRRLRLPQGS